MEANSVSTTQVTKLLQEFEGEVKSCINDTERMIADCENIISAYSSFMECSGAHVSGYPKNNQLMADGIFEKTCTIDRTFSTSVSIDASSIASNIKNYLETALEEMDKLVNQITDGYSIIDRIYKYTKEVENGLSLSYEEYCNLFDDNLSNHLWESEDRVGDDSQKMIVSDKNKQWWTDDNLLFEYNPNGNGYDAWIVYQMVDGKKVAMGWTDTQTAAKYSNEALNMLNKKKEICTKGINIATGTAIGTAIGGSVGSGIGATIGGGIESSIGDVKGISMENIKNDIASVSSQTFENSKNVLKNVSTDFSDITKRNLESITKSNLTPEGLKDGTNALKQSNTQSTANTSPLISPTDKYSFQHNNIVENTATSNSNQNSIQNDSDNTVKQSNTQSTTNTSPLISPTDKYSFQHNNIVENTATSNSNQNNIETTSTDTSNYIYIETPTTPLPEVVDGSGSNANIFLNIPDDIQKLKDNQNISGKITYLNKSGNTRNFNFISIERIDPNDSSYILKDSNGNKLIVSNYDWNPKQLYEEK